MPCTVTKEKIRSDQCKLSYRKKGTVGLLKYSLLVSAININIIIPQTFKIVHDEIKVLLIACLSCT